MCKRIAVIPARGGSKRIKKKNIIDFHGKPMIAWTIEAALSSNLFDDVVVSTDDSEIAAVSRAYGAFVPFLRKHFSDDHSPVSLATIGTLKQLKEELLNEYDVVVQLMANCPLRTAQDITLAVNNFVERRAVSQISCFKFGWMNPWWAFTLDKAGRANRLFEEAFGKRSQDLPPLYCPTGAIWIASNDVLETNKDFRTEDSIFYPMQWTSALDIDDYDDLMMAQLVFNYVKNKELSYEL